MYLATPVGWSRFSRKTACLNGFLCGWNPSSFLKYSHGNMFFQLWISYSDDNHFTCVLPYWFDYNSKVIIFQDLFVPNHLKRHLPVGSLLVDEFPVPVALRLPGCFFDPSIPPPCRGALKLATTVFGVSDALVTALRCVLYNHHQRALLSSPYFCFLVELLFSVIHLFTCATLVPLLAV